MKILKYILIAIVIFWAAIYFTNTLILVSAKKGQVFSPAYVCKYFNGRGFVTLLIGDNPYAHDREKDFCPNVYRQ